MTEKKLTILNVLDNTINNFWRFCKEWKVWGVYALAMFLLSAVCLNWSHSCKDPLAISWWCPQSSNIHFIYARIVFYYICSFFLVFAFVYDIYNAAFGTKKSDFKAIFCYDKQKLKIMGLLFVLCLTFFSALIVCFWLIFREPNPDWRIEFGYFLIVFTLASVVVLLLRTSASFGEILAEGKFPNFKKLFNLTHGKFYVILITFCVMTYAVNLLQMKIKGLLDMLSEDYSYFCVVLTGEFAGAIIQLAILAVYVAYFLTLSQISKALEKK